MEIINLICGLIGVLIAVLTFFGIRLGKKSLATEIKVYSEEAEKMYNSVKDTIPKEKMFGPYERGGRKIQTPQYEVRRIKYDPETMGFEYKNITKEVRYCYTDETTGKIMVHGWRL